MACALVVVIVGFGVWLALRDRQRRLTSLPDTVWASKPLSYIGPFDGAKAWKPEAAFARSRRVLGAVAVRVVFTAVGVRLVLAPVGWRLASWPRSDDVVEIPWEVSRVH
jgi:hypothetical protein